MKSPYSEVVAYPMKDRFIYLGAAGLLIVLGLAARACSENLPGFIAAHAGDALWAAMVYFGFRALFVRRGRLWAFFAALCFSFAIEFSQLYQAEWINEVRGTVLGALVLGRGFLAIDLVRYFVGCAIFFAADTWIAGRTTGRM